MENYNPKKIEEKWSVYAKASADFGLWPQQNYEGLQS